MLVEFKVRNFRSFAEQQSFSYSMSSDRAHESTHGVRTGSTAEPRLSKSAIIFGPNASGKSNLAIALATLRDLIMRGTAYSTMELAERHTPFQLGSSAHLPTEFVIEILLERVRYCYSMSYDMHRIRSERLLVYRAGKGQRWFERRFNEATRVEEWTSFSPNFKGLREMWRKATRPTALFLATAACLNSEQLQPLMHWFEHCLEVALPTDSADLTRVTSQLRDADFKARVLRHLRAAGMQVLDLRIREQRTPADHGVPHTSHHGSQHHPDHIPQIEFLHASTAGAPVWLDSEVEAAGTYRLLNLLGLLLEAIEHQRFLTIDGFDSGMHPLVARFLLRLINDPEVSGRAQLLITSHNTALMDLGLLRRDEIWLMSLNAQHASNLSSVLRSHPRRGELIAKSYLRGRYGAVPAISQDLHFDTVQQLHRDACDESRSIAAR